MKTFLIQTRDGEVCDDFAFELIEAVKFHKWYYNEDIYGYILSDTTDKPRIERIIRKYPNVPVNYSFEEIVPVGSVEFILEFLKRYCGILNIEPINIPEQLRTQEFLKRRIEYKQISTAEHYLGDDPIFIKDNNKIKGITKILMPNEKYPEGDFLVSECIDIESEWRSFVFHNQLVGLQNYSGDFTMFPDVKLVEKMISVYNNDGAYTLDVGINNKDTFLIECHDFFSCGLYGFSDYKLLTKMFLSTWNKLKGQKKD